jgi:hypothetical protein
MARHARFCEPLRIGDVFAVKEVFGTDTDPGHRQSGKVGAPRRYGDIGIGTVEVSSPTRTGYSAHSRVGSCVRWSRF